MRCVQVAFAVIFPGHRLRPSWAEAIVALSDFRRILLKRPELREVARVSWERKDAPGDAGPVRTAHLYVARKGWGWHSFEQRGRGLLPPLLVCHGAAAWWAHQVREGLRDAAI
eukprot:10089910-Alexandrium_andersonii.AAC.1